MATAGETQPPPAARPGQKQVVPTGVRGVEGGGGVPVESRHSSGSIA